MGRLKTAFEIALALVITAMAASIVWNWHHQQPRATQTQYAPAAPIPAVEKVKIVTVPGPPQIVTVEKEKIVHDLKLPDSIAKDPDKQVAATAQVGPYAGKTDAVSIMDTRTGESHMELKQEALPFFGFENGKEVGARAGIGLHGPEGVIYARWTFARTGRVFWAAYGEAGAPIASNAAAMAGSVAQANGKLMLDVSYRW